ANIKLPYVNYCLPYNFETLAVKVRDSLRSDHAPFLKYGIPAIMVTDTANFRYPFYHTEADTIDKLDFHFIRKVCQATLVTAVLFEKFLSKKAERKTTP
ncbi:MAG: M28 family peptidase, partial [Candidatus Heimdallarchaeota archaeon]